MSRLALAVVGIGLLASAVAGQPMRDEAAVMDSLSGIHPRLRNRWLNERGIEMPGMNAPMPGSGTFAESSGLHLVGKYGRGPSVEVTGRDSLVFLSLGSEVAILNFAEPDSPKVLAEVQAMGLVTQAALRDSFLYVGCKAGQAGIEVWNVHNPAAPVFRSRTATLLNDFCVRDTFLYLTQSLSGLNDTFKVYSTANPENVYLLGSCRDSGDAVAVTNNTAFLADRWGLYAIDVTNPRNPHKVGTYPGVPLSVEARNTICCVTFSNPNEPEWLEFDILDVSNPAAMQRLGYLSNAGAYDIFLTDTLAFLSGYSQGSHGFQVIDISDSTTPVALCSRPTPGAWGAWANLNDRAAYLADRTNGMVPIDITSLSNPVFGSKVLATCETQDISVQGTYAYLANLGVKVLDVADPTAPREVGHVDTVYRSQTVAARDSFAFAEWRVSYNVASIDISNPSTPKLAGGCLVSNPPEDMVLRDSFLYVAEDYRFQVLNVARPRSPTVVGTCNLPYMSYDLCLQDSLACVSNGISLNVLSVANPTAPRIIGTWTGYAIGLDIRDTFLYATIDVSGTDGLGVFSIANPASPRLLGSVQLSNVMFDVVVLDTLAYVAGWRVHLVTVADPLHPRQLGSPWTPPSANVRKIVNSPPYLYFACTDGGVCIVETTQTGVAEPLGSGVPPAAVSARPNVTRRCVLVNMGPEPKETEVFVYDVRGNSVAVGQRQMGQFRVVDLGGLPTGVYLLRVETATGSRTAKVIKTGG